MHYSQVTCPECDDTTVLDIDTESGHSYYVSDAICQYCGHDLSGIEGEEVTADDLRPDRDDWDD